MTAKKKKRLPGDPTKRQRLERIIRVDQAGEYGAVRIYEGQMAVLGQSKKAPALRHMAEQEKRHLDRFDALVAEHKVRPTALMPLWHVAGYVLGAATALMGEEAAMACTVAVEEVIDQHYADQVADLSEDPALRETVEEFRQDELEHRDLALAEGARQAPAYEALSAVVKVGSKLAIWLSERL
jgi:ubiquinone biosynthesis monooxygenase Coq7